MDVCYCEWKVVYQDVPFNSNKPCTLVVSAATRAGAYAVAYDRLTRMGFAVVSTGNLNSDEIREARSYGVPEVLNGNTCIRSVEPHAMTYGSPRVP